MTMEDVRLEARAGRLGTVMTAVAMDGPDGKEYRLPTAHEIEMARVAEADLARVFAEVPYGLPEESLAGADALGFRVPLYGFDQWNKLFTPRQLAAIGTLVSSVRRLRAELREDVATSEALQALMAVALDRTANYLSTICIWESQAEEVKQTFLRYALPITWDFAEGNPLAPNDRFFLGAVSSVGSVMDRVLKDLEIDTRPVEVRNQSAITVSGNWDVVVTDPPYYDAIPYSDLMDFFYVWLRRTLLGISAECDAAFAQPLAPKWNHAASDGELIDDCRRASAATERRLNAITKMGWHAPSKRAIDRLARMAGW
jgi:adenine-specific DNA methylase